MRSRWLARVVLPALACAAACCVAALASGAARSAPSPSPSAASRNPPIVVLVGGSGHEAAGRHEYAQGLARLAGWLRADGFAVREYPRGWPTGRGAFDGAAPAVWYFDGGDAHPLADAGRRARIGALAARGLGLVVLHQAATTRADADFGLTRLLGATRPGLYDRSTEWTRLAPPAPALHPVLRGVAAFAYRDEFYPTLRFATGKPAPQVLLQATLHPQYRDGAPVLSDAGEIRPVAWAYVRRDGGRVVGFSGAHFLAALEQPMLQRLLRNAVAWTAYRAVPPGGMPMAPMAPDAAGTPGAAPLAGAPVPVATFQQDRARSGQYRDASAIAPAQVAPGHFGLAWESLPFDAADGTPARLYASPLYLDSVRIGAGPERGREHAVVLVATNLGEVLAVNARRDGDLAPGRVLWRHAFGHPCRLQPAPLDGVPTGILSTPVVDLARQRVYVTHCDEAKRWQAHALDLRSGAPLPGWPVTLDEARFNAVNANAGPRLLPPTRKHDFRVQRGALNLSPDGTRLYVVFGESETGWLVAVDTVAPRVASAFAAVAMPHRGSGGIWGAGGPAVDADGRVYVVTGSGFDGYVEQDHDWTQSLLALDDTAAGLALRGTYTPFNHCRSAARDIDLGAGGAMLFDAPARAGAPARGFVAFGGKQGNAYLLERARLPGRLDRRPPCSDAADRDASLLAPAPQPQFGTRGPLNLFGPYSEQDAALDLARARSVPALWREPDGAVSLLFTGNTKAAEGSAQGVPPSLVRVRVRQGRGAGGEGAGWLEVAARDTLHVFGNPGTPAVSSQPDGSGAVAWVLDENAPRSASLAPGREAPAPVLYALDPATLRELWHSAPGALATSGKYNAPAFGGGLVFVGTDRLQAFGPGGSARTRPRQAAQAAQPAPVGATSAPVAGLRAPGAGATPAADWAQRCAACHDHAVGNIPPRALLATYPRARIVVALTSGFMRAQAAGLDAAQVAALADFVRAPPSVPPPPR
jgi:hypothetical protein